jgi:hypothetical protein
VRIKTSASRNWSLQNKQQTTTLLAILGGGSGVIVGTQRTVLAPRNWRVKMPQYDEGRMKRSHIYVEHAVAWMRGWGMFASPIMSQGFPDQGDALSWKLRDDQEKYWFRTIDVKEAHAWVDKDPPKSWGGFMLTRDGQLHASWVYIVVNRPMTRIAIIDMERYSMSMAKEIQTTHPETGKTQISMLMPYECFKFYDTQPMREIV